MNNGDLASYVEQEKTASLKKKIVETVAKAGKKAVGIAKEYGKAGKSVHMSAKRSYKASRSVAKHGKAKSAWKAAKRGGKTAVKKVKGMSAGAKITGAAAVGAAGYGVKKALD